MKEDIFEIGGLKFESRLLTGTGKYADDSVIPSVCEASGSQVITVALRRVDLSLALAMSWILSRKHAAAS